jgi:hypothetical protein
MRFVNTATTFKIGNDGDSLPHNPDPGPVRPVRGAESRARSLARSASNTGRPCIDGLTIFYVPYHRTFTQLASQVMKLVAEKHLLPESPDLPTCTINEESHMIQQAWVGMMGARARGYRQKDAGTRTRTGK